MAHRVKSLRLHFRRPGFNSWATLEKGMVTHSSILTWEIPWTGEPAGHSSWGGNESDMTGTHLLT